MSAEAQAKRDDDNFSSNPSNPSMAEVSSENCVPIPTPTESAL